MLRYPSVLKYYTDHRYDLMHLEGYDIRDRVAVIIEPRDIPTLSWTIHNIAYFAQWPIIAYHSKRNKHYFDSAPVTMKIEIADDFSIEDYNQLLCSFDFWNTKPEHVLIFQHDSFMLRSGLEAFMQYDYVGAPWERVNLDALPILYNIGNGGFSLRKRDKMIEIIRAAPDREGMPEDVYFGKGFLKVSRHLPKLKEQMKFSVEQIFYPKPVAVHAPWLAFDEPALKKMLFA